MKNIVLFNSLDELYNLTGLTREELELNGFNLDNFGWGFQSNDCFGELLPDDEGGLYHNHDYEHPVEVMNIIFRHLDTYSIGYECIEYKEKYYFINHR